MKISQLRILPTVIDLTGSPSDLTGSAPNMTRSTLDMTGSMFPQYGL